MIDVIELARYCVIVRKASGDSACMNNFALPLVSSLDEGYILVNVLHFPRNLLLTQVQLCANFVETMQAVQVPC